MYELMKIYFDLNYLAITCNTFKVSIEDIVNFIYVIELKRKHKILGISKSLRPHELGTNEDVESLCPPQASVCRGS